MGTRNLTAVKKGGQYKVAQYGQWDGYPSGQGSTILSFLHTLKDKANMDLFLAKIDQLTFATDADIESINQRIKSDNISDWSSVWPELSRDTGGEILSLIMQSEQPLKLRDEIKFAADSLFCEYAYVVDFDTNTFEIFMGFNEKPLQEGDRFYGMTREGRQNEYHPVRLVKSYQISDLPSAEQFISDLELSCDED